MTDSVLKLSSLRVLGLLLIFIALVAVFSSFSRPQSKPGECPAEEYCREWINGSCSGNMQYTERECYRVFRDCAKETYYESRQVEVDSCK